MGQRGCQGRMVAGSMQDTRERPLPSLLLSGSSAGEGVLSPRKPGCESWLVRGGHEYGTEHGIEVSVERWRSGGQ